MAKSAKLLVFFLCVLPLCFLAFDVWREYQQPGSALGAEPAEAVVHFLGNWAVRMLLITLSISSLSRRIRTLNLIPFRRMLGLFAFAYVCLHFASYFFLLAGGEWAGLLEDFSERPYITVGISAFLLLVPLAITSTRGWQRRLRQSWKKLHRLVYAVAILAVVHIAWLAKSSYLEAVMYATWVGCLLLERLLIRGRAAVQQKQAT